MHIDHYEFNNPALKGGKGGVSVCEMGWNAFNQPDVNVLIAAYILVTVR